MTDLNGNLKNNVNNGIVVTLLSLLQSVSNLYKYLSKH